MTPEEEEFDRLSNEVIEQIEPILSAARQDVQGVVIAELLGRFLATHHPLIRDHARTTVLSCAEDMCDMYSAMVRWEKPS